MWQNVQNFCFPLGLVIYVSCFIVLLHRDSYVPQAPDEKADADWQDRLIEQYNAGMRAHQGADARPTEFDDAGLIHLSKDRPRTSGTHDRHRNDNPRGDAHDTRTIQRPIPRRDP